MDSNLKLYTFFGIISNISVHISLVLGHKVVKQHGNVSSLNKNCSRKCKDGFNMRHIHSKYKLCYTCKRTRLLNSFSIDIMSHNRLKTSMWHACG